MSSNCLAICMQANNLLTQQIYTISDKQDTLKFVKATNMVNYWTLFILSYQRSSLWADAFYKSVCPSVRLSVRLFTFEVKFKCLFAPTSRCWMYNILRDSESPGKSNGKKWSQIWTFLFGSGLKLQNKTK